MPPLLEELINKIKELHIPCKLEFEYRCHQYEELKYYSARIITIPHLQSGSMPVSSYHSSLEEAKISAALQFYLKHIDTIWQHMKVLMTNSDKLGWRCIDEHLETRISSFHESKKGSRYNEDPMNFEMICDFTEEPNLYKVDLSRPCAAVMPCKSFDD